MARRRSARGCRRSPSSSRCRRRRRPGSRARRPRSRPRASPSGRRASVRTSAAPASSTISTAPTRARLPPVELDGVVDADVGEPGLDAERHDEQRRAAGLRGERLDARLVEVVVVVVRDQRRHRCAADRPAASPGGTCALRADEATPATRARRTSDRSARLMPPTCTSVLAWPIQVSGRLHRRAGDGVAAQEVEVGRRRAASRCGGWRQAVAQRIELPLQERAQALRLEVEVVVLEAAVAMMRRCRGPAAAAADDSGDRRRSRRGGDQGEQEGERRRRRSWRRAARSIGHHRIADPCLGRRWAG